MWSKTYKKYKLKKAQQHNNNRKKSSSYALGYEEYENNTCKILYVYYIVHRYSKRNEWKVKDAK